MNELTANLNLRMQSFARDFPGNAEFSGYLVGDNANTLTNLVLPRNMIGLDVDADDSFKLKELNDPDGSTVTMLGIERGKEILGVQVVTSKEGATQDRNQFFPSSRLILSKPLVSYLSDQDKSAIFSDLAKNEITDDLLIAAISSNNGALSHTYFNTSLTLKQIDFLPIPLEVDMFGGLRSLHPVKEFILYALSRNQAGNGNIYGLTHIHFGFTDQELSNGPLLYELAKIDEGFNRFISPDDAVQLINSRSIINLISNGEIDMSMGLLGVTALEPISKEIMGCSYFNAVNLAKPENSQEFQAFKDITSRAHKSTDIGVLKEFYSCVAAQSPASLPKFVGSIREGQIPN